MKDIQIRSIIFTVLFFPWFNLFSQDYQMVRYDIASGNLDTLQQVNFDSSKISDHTGWNYGSNNEIELLNLNPPSNTYNNSGFTDYFPAHSFFNINKYPIRAAVKIFRTVNDTLKQKCSGILVSRNYVLTACHCIGDYDSLDNFIFEDSTHIYPAYDNGSENPFWETANAAQFVTFKENMKDFYKTDIALIKLEDSIGTKNGWIGLGFNDDDSFFRENVFHKLSYPGTIDGNDSARVYNGDTLYYNYGKLDLINNIWIGYNINGIRGQSGSSLFYTDNGEYYSLGTLVWSSNSRHIRINKEIFYSFKSVIDNSVTNYKDNKDIISYHLSEPYPNPFNPAASIRYTIPEGTQVKIILYNLLSEELINLVDDYRPAGSYELKLNGKGLSSGLYIVVMKAGRFMDSKKLMLIK